MPASRKARKRRPGPPAPGAPAGSVEEAAAARTAEEAATERPGAGPPTAAAPASGAASPSSAAPPSGDAMRRGYARSEERNAAVRAGIEPLAPGERPPALRAAVALAVFVAVANVGLWAAGEGVSDADAGPVGVLAFAAIMLAAAGGMWAGKAWALLGFQALLAITIVFSFLALTVASNVAALALCLVFLVGGGWLFWKLIRVLARIQAPARQG